MDWKPHKFDAPNRAFPTKWEGYMPAWKDLPHPFGSVNHQDGHDACRMAQLCFVGPLPEAIQFHAVEDISAEAAFHHIHYLLRSWEPKHEHKIGGVGYLISLWFTKIIVPNEDGEDEVLWQQPTST